eukprot:CAMPEP_0197198460 /NCGR_PEP_ID=MMETSP1423-20130617/33383_1 /TAXON_ID=476441 /ORGANISM="Pseudo-nitzschia heimii, Strain UNC1101" /LENGTH=529 /DNA_ID=CAMNT_0042652293 /DNA_START=263 /DNA_END=1853 /DNA_ORIENTATION=-
MVVSSSPVASFTVGKGMATAMGTMVALAFLTGNGVLREEEEMRVAMIGNSLMYYNDLPRLLEAMSNGHLSQDSCLHGAASFKSHLLYGNGMFVKWDTGNARIWNVDNADNYDSATEAYQEYMESVYYNNDDAYNDDNGQRQYTTYKLDTKYSHIYDFGACTVRQLLLGVDERLVEEYENDDDQNNDDSNEDDRRRRQRQRRRISERTTQQDRNPSRQQVRRQETIIIPSAEERHHRLEDATNDDDYYKMGDDNPVDDEQVDYYANVDDSFNENFPLTNDGKNPCLLSANYYFFKQSQYDEFNGGVPKWDYILLNDNSRGPCCTSPREEGIELLVDVYVPWILKTGAVTHAYWPSSRDMSGLTDIPTFMSLTYEGYREYAEAIGQLLPEHQQPKLAPVGLAFLLIWEENPTFWQNLIHMDEIHLTPTGTFLEGLVVYATLYGHLPSPSVVLNGDVANLFSNARRMTPSEHIQEAYPTLDNARYLYHIASRIMNGEIPRTFIHYTNGESVDFTASDTSKNNNNQNNNNNNR